MPTSSWMWASPREYDFTQMLILMLITQDGHKQQKE